MIIAVTTNITVLFRFTALFIIFFTLSLNIILPVTVTLITIIDIRKYKKAVCSESSTAF